MKTVFTTLLLCVIGVLLYYFYENNFKTQSSNYGIAIPSGFNSLGIDVSHHQGKINWKTVFESQFNSDSIDFVYCKATEAKNHVDSQWSENRKWLLKHNVKHGAYHFFAPKSYPLPQVDNFLSHWKKEDTDLPPVLDVETEGFSDEDLVSKMKIWLATVEERTGMRPIIYTSYHFYKTKFKTQFPKYKFWIAAYSRKPSAVNDKNVIHWQFSEKGRIKGIKENVDFNVSKIKF